MGLRIKLALLIAALGVASFAGGCGGESDASQVIRLPPGHPATPAATFELPISATNPPSPPSPTDPRQTAPEVPESQWLVTDYWPLPTFSPELVAVSWNGSSAATQLSPTPLVQNGIAVVPSVPYRGHGFDPGLPAIRSLPSVRRRVHWKLVNGITDPPTPACPTCSCNFTVATESNGSTDSTLACTLFGGIDNAAANQWIAALSLAPTDDPLASLNTFFKSIENSPYEESVSGYLAPQSAGSTMLTCGVPNEPGWVSECELWIEIEVYDIVGPDGQPWTDPVYQAALPPPLSNSLDLAWLDTIFDCSQGLDQCVVLYK